jgi:BA14K-like protein
MRAKVLNSIVALALASCAVIGAALPASAAWGWHGGWHHGWGDWEWGGAAAAGVVGGALAAATAPLWAPGYYDYYPGYVYGPGPYIAVTPPVGSSVAYCEARFRSYDPATGTYLGFDGLRHPCP